MRVYMYSARPVEDWEKNKVFGIYPRVSHSDLRDEYTVMHHDERDNEGRGWIVRCSRLWQMPGEVLGLDWETFAKTLQVPEWVARMIYSRETVSEKGAEDGNS